MLPVVTFSWVLVFFISSFVSLLQYDSYEEIELTDSEDEQDDPGRIQPLLKSRVSHFLLLSQYFTHQVTDDSYMIIFNFIIWSI